MLNINSPTVQAMLKNTPNGIGNIPIYYGSSPVITETVQPVQQSTQMPFPSPKEMLTSQGQNTIYTPTSFASTNIVGGYNPGYQAAFQGYSNPYMGYGTYGGNYYPNIYGYNYTPMDDDTRERLEIAEANGLTYDQQLKAESSLYKSISRIVSKNLDRDPEKAKECEEYFNIYNKYPTQSEEKKAIKPIYVAIKEGDTIVAEFKPDNVSCKYVDYNSNAYYVEQLKMRNKFNQNAKVARMDQMYSQALERQFDNMDMLTFFNYGAGVLMADSLNRTLYEQSIGRTSKLYNRDEFKKRLLENNGLKSKEQLNAIDRYTGRYGIMPDGRPVSPGHDPSVAESFSYNPETGQYTITAPNFISDRMERARQSFINSLD